MTEEALRSTFATVGTLKSVKCVELLKPSCRAAYSPCWLSLMPPCRLMVDRESRSSKGYAFVAYYDIPTAQNAVSSLSSVQLGGRPLRLGFAEDRPDKENPIDPGYNNAQVGQARLLEAQLP